MPVKCAQCGEELLGAVNKCWRCGQLVESHPEVDVPPVVQPPILITPPVITPAEGDLIAEAQLVGQPTNVAAENQNMRSGSPFAKTQRGTWQHWRQTTGREWNASTISAWVAVVVAIYGWVLTSFNPFVAFAVAVVSLGLGIFGLWGRHRPAAVVAIILCCLLIAFAGYHMFVDIFTWAYGYAPFAEPENSDTWPPVPSGQ